MSGKQIWIIEDDGNRLVKFRECNNAGKAPVANMYRYTYAEKWERETCTGTPSTCTGTPMQKSGREQPVPVHH